MSKKTFAIIAVILVAVIAVGYVLVIWEAPLPPMEPGPERHTFAIMGAVTASDTSPIEGANMTLFYMVGGALQKTTDNVTDSNGNYVLNGDYATPINYTVTAEATGYKKSSSKVYVTNATDYTVNFVLETLVIVEGVYLEPLEIMLDTSEVSVGYRFNVTAMVSNVTDLHAYQVALYYNASVITLTSASLPTDHVLAGQLGFPLLPAYVTFDSWGVCNIGYTCFAGATSFTGDGKLAVFEFEIIAEPPEGGTLTSDLIISYKPTGGMYETKLKDSAGGYISFTATDGHYEYTG